ncbi:MAG: hypothetical protein WCJ35_12320 [Planctomycetota bacterium]
MKTAEFSRKDFAVPSLRPAALWFIVICGLVVPKGISAADPSIDPVPPKTTTAILLPPSVAPEPPSTDPVPPSVAPEPPSVDPMPPKTTVAIPPPRSAVPVPPSMDTLLPDTTVGFISATNSVRLTEQWNKTQLSKLMADPVMKPFEEDFRVQMQSQWSVLSGRLGIHLDDLRGVSTGEASLALIEPQPGKAATSLLLDVSGNLDKAKALLAKARAGLKGSGAQETLQTICGTSVYVYVVPLSQDQQVATGKGGAAATAATGQTVYFLTENFFGACDDLAVVQDILTRLVNGGQAGSLSQVTGYQMVMKRCAADAPADHAPGIRWFIHPLGYAEAVRAATPPEKRRKGKTIIEIMRNQGCAAFKGIGGYIDVSTDGYQILHRTAVFAPPPYKESMKMLVFPNNKDFAPQPWVGRDVATYFTVYVDILNAFDNFGSLYDEIINEKGVWKQTLDGMATDPSGPQIDLRKELIANLGQRVTMVTDYNLPITTTSERLLWAIETKDEAAVAKAIEKCVKNDPTIKKRSIAGHVVWEIVEEEDTEVPMLKVDVPTLTPKKDEGKSKSDDKDDQETEGHFLPHGAIAVARGQLFVASHIDFLVKTLEPLDEKSRLATQPEFQQVWNVTFDKLGLKQQASRGFSWTDRAVQPTYELIRQGKMPQSESLLGRALNSMAASSKSGLPRHQRIDGSKLPDFEVVRKALGPSSAAMTSEENGWFAKGVLMTK